MEEEQSLRSRALQRCIQDIWTRNAEADPDEIQRIVDEAVSEVREERRACSQRAGPTCA